MDLRDCQALVALAEHAHFGRAAEALGVSQPALTKRLGLLERRLGGALLKRHPRGASLTPAGRLLSERAVLLLQHSAEAERLTRSVIAGQTGFLRIGAGLSALLTGLPSILRDFRRQYPGIEVSVRDMSTPQQCDALRQGQIDVGFLRAGGDLAGLTVRPILTDELRLACPAHLATHVAKAKPARLFAQPLVTIARVTSPTFHDHVLATCRAAGYAPPEIRETNQLLAVLALVQAGAGISLVPRSMQSLAMPGVRLLATPLPGAGWTIGLAYLRQTPPNAAVTQFVRLARDAWPQPPR